MLNHKTAAAEAVLNYHVAIGGYFCQNLCSDVEADLRGLVIADIGSPAGTITPAPSLLNIASLSFTIYSLIEFLRELKEISLYFKHEYDAEINGILISAAAIDIKETSYLLNRSFNHFVYADDNELSSFKSIVGIVEMFRSVSELLAKCQMKNDELVLKGGEKCLK